MPVQFAKTLPEDDLAALVEYLALLGVADRPRAIIERVPLKIVIKRPEESTREPFAVVPGTAATDAQLTLGKLLFFDRRLSNNNSLSCASWHQPDKALTDGGSLSRGYPSLKFNRVESLEMSFSWLNKNGHIRIGHGQLEAVAMLTTAVPRGVLFTYFLLPGSTFNSLAHRVPDPITNNYRYKLAKARITRVGESPYKYDHRFLSFRPRAFIG